MGGTESWHEFKCFGSATVGPRGQVVIPAHARKELGIEVGATLLVFSGPGRKGVTLFKADAVEKLIKVVSGQLTTVESLLAGHTKSKTVVEAPGRKVDEKK